MLLFTPLGLLSQKFSEYSYKKNIQNIATILTKQKALKLVAKQTISLLTNISRKVKRKEVLNKKFFSHLRL